MNNKKKNAHRIPYTHKTGYKVLLVRFKTIKYREEEYDGLYTVIEVHENGSVNIQQQIYTEVVNMRKLIPYHE